MSDPIRGQIYWLNWEPGRGSEQTGRRPSLVVQNNPYNQASAYVNTIVVTISSKGRDIPTHVKLIPDSVNGLRETSYIKCEQLYTINKERLEDYIGEIGDDVLREVDNALKKVLGLV